MKKTAEEILKLDNQILELENSELKLNLLEYASIILEIAPYLRETGKKKSANALLKLSKQTMKTCKL